MNIPDAMVTAGAIAGDVTDDKAREIIEAALAAVDPEWIEVRQLDWHTPTCGPEEYSHIGKSDAIGYEYEVRKSSATHKPWNVTRSTEIQPFGCAESLAAAIRVAQADFERRVRSAILPPSKQEKA